MQDILAISIVLAAAAFLARRMWQSMAKRRSACGACSNCPSNATTKTPALVSLSPIVSHTKPQGFEESRN